MDTGEGCALQHGGSEPRPAENNGIVVNNRVIDTLLQSAPQDYISRRLIILFLIEFECCVVTPAPPICYLMSMASVSLGVGKTPIHIIRIWAIKLVFSIAAH